MNRVEMDVINAGPDTTFGVRCDGEKIEETVCHDGLFIIREISTIQAAEKMAAYQRCLLQMMWKAEREK